METQLTVLIRSVNEGRAANDTRLEAIQASLELWRPAVSNLQRELDELRTQVRRIALHPALVTQGETVEEVVVPPAPSPPPTGPENHGPSGHGEILNSGGGAHGVVNTLQPPPVKGTYQSPPENYASVGVGSSRMISWEPPHATQQSPHTHHWALPKLDFPQFDGENPQFWKSRCEK